ncbi:MAG: hypothetical protein IH623_08720 [Verrucomicrobia bacterium]|nr:hypothetical protein [Verrucomicrobiota bacterium]
MKLSSLCGMAALLGLLVSSPAGLAQLPSLNLGGGGAASGADLATLARLFGSHTGFTAKSDIRVYDKDHKETVSTLMNFAYLDNKARCEIDMTHMKHKDLPAGIADQLQQFGMDQVVSIVRPDKKSLHVIYPKLQSYVTLPLAPDNLEAVAKAKTTKERLGTETLDGQPCVKHKVTLTTVNGEKQELTVWNASNLKDFPVQILTKQDEGTVITRYRQVQLARPEAKLFDPPATFKEYPDMQSFMQGVLAKIMGDALSETK